MKNFEAKVIDQLARIEERVASIHEKLDEHIEESKEVRLEVRKNTQFRKLVVWIWTGLIGLSGLLYKLIGVK